MILLVFVAIGLILALILGGRIENLARVHFRLGYLVLLALAIQVMVFSPWWRRMVGTGFWVEVPYTLSLLLLLLAVWLNRRVPGLLLLGLGLFLNAAVILANGGRMPASLEALRMAGIADSTQSFAALPSTNSSLIGPDTPLWFLGDIFAIPKGIPLANVFSIGDVFIALGAIWFLFGVMFAHHQES